MLDSYLRPIYQYYLINPLAHAIKRFSPEKITYGACVTGILAASLLAWHHYFLATLFLLLSGMLDALDGTVARLNGKTTDLGMILNILSNRLVEVAMFLGLFAVDPSQRGWYTLAMLASSYLCINSFLVVGLFSPKTTNEHFPYTPGLIERAEAFGFFLLMIWFPHSFNVLASLFTGLVILTSIMHFRKVLKDKFTHRIVEPYIL